MTEIKDYTEYKIKSDLQYGDSYAEVGQTSKTKFSVCSVDHENKTITQLHRPIKCREFLSDWAACHSSGVPCSIYGFKHTPKETDLNPCDVLLVHGPKGDLDRILSKNNISPFHKYVCRSELGTENILVLSAPPGVMYTPLGIMTYTCLFRAMVYDDSFSSAAPATSFSTLYVPNKNNNESIILRAALRTMPLTFMYRLMFDEEYNKFLVTLGDDSVSSKDKLDGWVHNTTGPQAMSSFLGMKKKVREQLLEGSRPYQVEQYTKIQEAMQHYAEGN